MRCNTLSADHASLIKSQVVDKRGHSFDIPNINSELNHWNQTVTLQWRQNERDGVSNHRRLDCLLDRMFRRRSRKTSKPRVTGLCEGNSPVNSPHKGPVTRTNFHLMTSSWINYGCWIMSLAFVRGIHRWPVQRASNAENVSIWWRLSFVTQNVTISWSSSFSDVMKNCSNCAKSCYLTV